MSESECSEIHSAAELGDDDVCYICLDGERDGEPLVHPCSCPRRVHAACLAKWQLNCAGKDEETRCRFCQNVLPDWRPALTPTALKPAASVMSVRYRGVTHRITYTPGPDGLQQFLETLQGIGIKVASASQVTFLCRSPDTGEEMSLKGLKAFDAAAYCASITAAKRVAKDADKRQRRQQQQQQAAAAAAALAQQQQHAGHEHDVHAVDASPHSDHAAADLGVRPDGPDSPHAGGHCDRQVAHVHAEAGPLSDRQRQQRVAALQADRAHQAFYAAPARASSAAAPAAAVTAAAAAAAAAAQLEHESWWRRALACVHRHDARRHSA